MNECGDENCPFHGSLKTRGTVREGLVVSVKALKMAVVETHFTRRVQKYERVEKKKSRIHAHLPPCIKAKVGDTVQFCECRKVSKTKSHVVTKVLKQA